MPVSKRGRKSAKMTTQRREEQKRINRIRGTLANGSMTPEEAKVYIKAMRDKSSPYEMLLSTRDTIIEPLKSLDLITLTNARFNEMEDFKEAFKKAKPELFDRIVDAAASIEELINSTNGIVTDNEEAFKALGKAPKKEEWITTFPVLDSFNIIHETSMSLLENYLHCVKDIYEFLGEVSTFTDVNIAKEV